MAASTSPLQEDGMPCVPRPVLSPAGRGVCRSLFGPIDHDELRSELKRQLKEIQASDCQRWNFDFEAGAPLRGPFCWEPLESREMPSLYRESRPPCTPPTLGQQLCTRLADPDTREEAVGTRDTPKCAKENTARRCHGGKGPSKSSSRLRKRESCTVITDFFPKRKRQVPKNDSQKSVIAICTLEQTPRKIIR